MDGVTPRLDKIDEKLDKLSDAISQLARIEERISNQTSTMNKLYDDITSLEKRVRAIEYQSSARGVVIGSVERFGWLVITAAIGIAAYYFKS